MVSLIGAIIIIGVVLYYLFKSSPNNVQEVVAPVSNQLPEPPVFGAGAYTNSSLLNDLEFL